MRAARRIYRTLGRLALVSTIFGVVQIVAPPSNGEDLAVVEEVVPLNEVPATQTSIPDPHHGHHDHGGALGTPAPEAFTASGAALVTAEVRQISLERPAELVGFSWTGQPELALEVRAQVDGAWTDWLDLHGQPTGITPEASEPERGFAGPAWIGRNASTIEVRTRGDLPPDLAVTALDTTARSSRPSIGAQPAAAAIGRPGGIVTRSEWGADESVRTARPDCVNPDVAGSVKMVVVHHTDSANSYAAADVPGILRGFYKFHTETNGWCDLGYNFLIDRFGTIYEGRFGGMQQAVIAAHAGGFNTYSTGIALIGSHVSAPVPPAAYQSLVKLTAWKMALHRIPVGTFDYVVNESSCNCQRWPEGTSVRLNTIAGHGDLNATDCPGGQGRGVLASLRADVAALLRANPEPAALYVAQSNPPTRVDHVLAYGDRGDVPLMCDFNGDGVDTPVIFRGGQWFVKDRLGGGIADRVFHYGSPGDVPLCGRWFGGSADGPAVFRGGQFFLRGAPTTGVADLVASYGDPNDLPLVGDWDGDGRDSYGVFRGGEFFLKNVVGGPGLADVRFGFGNPSDLPVAGDWNADGRDTVGVYRNGSWYLRNSNSTGTADGGTFQYGSGFDRALVAELSRGGRSVPVSAVHYG